MHIPAASLHEAVMTLLGITLALTPLAMWVAPNSTILAIVLTVSVVSGFAVWTLSLLGHSAPDNAVGDEPPRLPDKFVAELHKLSPLTYHHSGMGDTTYQRKIDSLRKYLDC